MNLPPTEGLDEPGACVTAPEGVVVPKRGLKDQEVRKVWDLVGGRGILTCVSPTQINPGVRILKW